MTGFQLTDRVNRSAELVPQPCGPPSFSNSSRLRSWRWRTSAPLENARPLAVQDRDLGRLVEVEAAQRVGELRDDLVADRVQLVRPIDRDRRDAIGDRVFDEVRFVHAAISSAQPAGPALDAIQTQRRPMLKRSSSVPGLPDHIGQLPFASRSGLPASARRRRNGEGAQRSP